MYIDVVNILKKIANEINPDGTFYEGRVSDANRYLQNEAFPQIHLYPFRITRFDNRRSIDNIPNILMAFLFQDSPSSDDEERREIVNEADELQRKFQALLDAYDITYSNYEAEPFYKQFNGVCSGMFVRFQMQLKSKVDCEIEEEVEPTPPPLPCTDDTWGYWSYCGTPQTEPQGWKQFSFTLDNARPGNLLQFRDFENDNLYIDFGIQINTGAIGLRSYPNVPIVFSSFVTTTTLNCWCNDDLTAINLTTGVFTGGNPDEMTLTNFNGSISNSIQLFRFVGYAIEINSLNEIMDLIDGTGQTNGTLEILTAIPVSGFDTDLYDNLINKGWTINFSV